MTWETMGYHDSDLNTIILHDKDDDDEIDQLSFPDQLRIQYDYIDDDNKSKLLGFILLARF